LGRTDILGVPFDPVTLDGAVGRICSLLSSPSIAGPRVVVTANPEIVEAALRDEELMDILNRADLVVADGVGVVWASRVLGRALPGRVAGADLVERLFEEGRTRGWRFYFLGARPGVAEEASQRVRARYEGLEVVGVHHGYFQKGDEEEVVRNIRVSGADILLVGLGAPRQEKWIFRNRHMLGVKLCIGVGGTLDVLSGRVRRAPDAMRRAGVEWLYRLITQPSRLGRMARLPLFAWHVLLFRYGRGGIWTKHRRD